MELNVDERCDRAVALFKEGYNCAQAVYMAYSDLFGMNEEQAARIVSSLGGGMGRLREVCGAVSGMFMIVAQRYPIVSPTDREAKTRNYKVVQQLAARFREKNGGIVCRDLLGLDHDQDQPVPEKRTAEYYRKRPCAEYVRDAAFFAGEMLREAERPAAGGRE